MWVSRHPAGLLSAAVLTVLAGVAGLRLATPWLGGSPQASAQANDRAAEDDAAGPADASPALADLARRLQSERLALAAARKRVAALLAEAEACDRRAALLHEMLEAGRLTEEPAFLREEASVRALQGLLREVSVRSAPTGAERDRLSDAEAIARERLRLKLRLLEGAMEAEARRRRDEAAALRAATRGKAEDLRQDRASLLRRLEP